MGAWGTSLYDNDTTCDIRGDYLDKLKRGKNNEETTQELIEEYRDIFGNLEEEPLFWFALADTQWHYGRLVEEVKQKALYFLSQTQELDRWKESQEKCSDWLNTLNRLKEQLQLPMPSKKRIPQYRLYQCRWKIGDIYAYRFQGDYSREKGFWGKYVIFKKIAEDTYWPGHIVPVVQVYKWVGEQLPELSTLTKMNLLVQNMTPTTLLYKPYLEKKYTLTLIATSDNDVPNENLEYMGNLGVDILQNQSHSIGCKNIGWDGRGYNKSFESYIINQYLAWEGN